MSNLTAEEILAKVLYGTTEYQHRANPKRQRIEHIADTWALMRVAGSSYGCGYGRCYVPGGMQLILLPEGLHCSGYRLIWDSGLDQQGALTKKRIARIIQVVAECVAVGRVNASTVARTILANEFPAKPRPVPVRKAVKRRRTPNDRF